MMKKLIAILLAVLFMLSAMSIAVADEDDREMSNRDMMNRRTAATNVTPTAVDGATDSFVGCVSKCLNSIHSIYEVAAVDYKDGFPDEYYEACPERGTVTVVKAINSNGNSCWNKICVYTPYGYEVDQNMKCNVVFLVHGSGGDMHGWIDEVYEMPVKRSDKKKAEISGSKLFDWLIYTGRVEPFIAVSVSMYSDPGSMHYSYSRYAELADQIEKYYLPYLVREYRTFAESDAEEDIIAAKDHFMIAGLSQGAICLSAIALEPEKYINKCFGNIVIMSNYTSGDVVSKKFGDSEDKLYFVSGGRADSNKGGSPYEITKSYTRFANLKTAKFFEFDSGHKWYTWLRGIAAILQISMK